MFHIGVLDDWTTTPNQIDLVCHESMGPPPANLTHTHPFDNHRMPIQSIISTSDDENVGFSDYYCGAKMETLPKTKPIEDLNPKPRKRTKMTKMTTPAPYDHPIQRIPAMVVDENTPVEAGTPPLFTLDYVNPCFYTRPVEARFDYLHRLCHQRFGTDGILYHRVYDISTMFMPDRVTLDTILMTPMLENQEEIAKGNLVGVTKCIHSKRQWFVCMQCFERTWAKPYIHNTLGGVIHHCRVDHTARNPGLIHAKKIYE